MDLVKPRDKAMIGRIVCKGFAALLALSGTGFMVALLAWDMGRPGDVAWPWLVSGWSAVLLSWLGVWGWWRDRLDLAALGAWASVWPNGWLWSLLSLPIVFSLATTIWAGTRTWRSIRMHRRASNASAGA